MACLRRLHRDNYVRDAKGRVAFQVGWLTEGDVQVLQQIRTVVDCWTVVEEVEEDQWIALGYGLGLQTTVVAS